MTHESPQILIENSTWNNIGDAFYQWSLQRMIGELVGPEKVAGAEGPIGRAFRPSGRFAANALDLLGRQRAPLHVFSGPILKHLVRSYAPAIRRLADAGERYMLLSVSSAESSAEELESTRALLREHPPVAFSSRDPQTYDLFKNAVPSAYNGICTAFLVNRLPVAKCELDTPYVTSSFYRSPEPHYRPGDDPADVGAWQVEPRRTKLGLPWRFARQVDWMQDYPDSVGPYKVVRTHQSISYRFSNLNFPYPNTFLSYNPTSFFSLYAGTECTFSDRVHACAATLAMGRPARLLFKGERAGIFDRFDLDHRSGGLMRLEPERLEREERAMASYVAGHLDDLGLMPQAGAA